MPKYIMVYLGGEHPSNPEEEKAHLDKYQRWIMSLGDAMVAPAVPFKDTHTVRPDGSAAPGSTTAMSGLSIIRATSMAEALEIAKSCPFLEINGTLEVSEMIEMSDTAPRSANEKLN